MRAGTLNRRIVFKRATSTVDSAGYGGPTRTWSTFMWDPWAKVNPLSGRESNVADMVIEALDTEFTIRYTSSVRPDDVIEYNGKTYNIISIIDVGDARRELRILATQVTT